MIFGLSLEGWVGICEGGDGIQISLEGQTQAEAGRARPVRRRESTWQVELLLEVVGRKREGVSLWMTLIAM